MDRTRLTGQLAHILISAAGLDANGDPFTESVSNGTASASFNNATVNWSDIGVGAAGALGSAIGNMLGGNSLVGRIGASTVVGTLASDLAGSIFGKPVSADGDPTGDGFGKVIGGLLDNSLGNAFGEMDDANLGMLFSQSFQSNAISGISGLFTGELAQALGLSGFGAGFFSAVGLRRMYNRKRKAQHNPRHRLVIQLVQCKVADTCTIKIMALA